MSRLRRLFGRRQIPRVLHRIWLGPEPLPEEHRAFGEGWARHHPDWEQRYGAAGVQRGEREQAMRQIYLPQHGKLHRTDNGA